MTEPCARCGRPMIRAKHTPLDPGQVRHKAKGYCNGCREAVRSQQRCQGSTRTTWPNADLMAEWDLLRRQGYTIRDAATRLGVTFAALDRAICRGANRGDPRAVRRAA